MKSTLSVLAGLLLAAISLYASPSGAAGTSQFDEYDFQDVSELPSLTDGHARTLRLYWAFFDREPDAEGSLFWVNQFNQCWTLNRIATFFSTSDEFVATYGESVSDGDFVDIIYANVLDRSAEPAGRAYWLDEIASGRKSRVEVMLDFAYSDEFVGSHPLPSDGIPDQPCSSDAPDIFANVGSRAVDYFVSSEEDCIAWANQIGNSPPNHDRYVGVIAGAAQQAQVSAIVDGTGASWLVDFRDSPATIYGIAGKDSALDSDVSFGCSHEIYLGSIDE